MTSVETFTPFLLSTVPGSTTSGVVECRVTGSISVQVGNNALIAANGAYNYMVDLSRDGNVSVGEDPKSDELVIARGSEGTTIVLRYEMTKSFARETSDTSYYARIHQSGNGPLDGQGAPINLFVTQTPTVLSCVVFDLE